MPDRIAFVSFGLSVHLPLLPTPPRGDAVTVGYMLESTHREDLHLSDDVRSQAALAAAVTAARCVRDAHSPTRRREAVKLKLDDQGRFLLPVLRLPAFPVTLAREAGTWFSSRF